jgi:hypothetical protein
VELGYRTKIRYKLSNVKLKNSRDVSVGTAVGYRLDFRGINVGLHPRETDSYLLNSVEADFGTNLDSYSMDSGELKLTTTPILSRCYGYLDHYLAFITGLHTILLN